MPAVRAGSLNRRGLVQSQAITQDGYGAQSLTWSTDATVWMSLEPLTGRELTAAQQISTEVSHQIIIRWQSQWADPKLMAKRRITYKGRLFNIHASMDVEDAHTHIILLASEGLNNG